MLENINQYRILVGKPEASAPFGKPIYGGRILITIILEILNI